MFKVPSTVGGGPYMLLPYSLVSVVYLCPKAKEATGCGGKLMEARDGLEGLALAPPLCDLQQASYLPSLSFQIPCL